MRSVDRAVGISQSWALHASDIHGERGLDARPDQSTFQDTCHNERERLIRLLFSSVLLIRLQGE